MKPARRASSDVPADIRRSSITSLTEYAGREPARTTQVRLISEQIGVDERTVWRWLEVAEAEGRVARSPRCRLEITEQDVHDLAYHRGNIAAFLRSRAASGSTMGYDAWRRGFARVLSPGRLAGLRLGERARREFGHLSDPPAPVPERVVGG